MQKYGIVAVMSTTGLPGRAAALTSLRANGDQFASVPLAPRRLGRATYRHPTNGQRPVTYDPRVLAGVMRFYSNTTVLRDLLQDAGGDAWPTRVITADLGRLVERNSFIWSVSGYATIGHPCDLEATALERVYEVFRQSKYRPSLVCDGAAGAGVLGISGVLAEHAGIPTLGITPLQGMASMAPRRHMIVHGSTYADREVAIGAAGDILLVVGGGGLDAVGKPKGALNEALAAARSGGVVVLLAQRSTDPTSFAQAWRQQRDMTEAMRQGRVIVIPLTTKRAIANGIHQATLAAATTPQRVRQSRIRQLQATFNH